MGRGSPAGIAEAVAGRDLGRDDGSDKWGRLVRGKGVTRALACGSGWQVGLGSERGERARGVSGAGGWAWARVRGTRGVRRARAERRLA